MEGPSSVSRASRTPPGAPDGQAAGVAPPGPEIRDGCRLLSATGSASTEGREDPQVCSKQVSPLEAAAEHPQLGLMKASRVLQLRTSQTGQMPRGLRLETRERGVGSPVPRPLGDVSAPAGERAARPVPQGSVSVAISSSMDVLGVLSVGFAPFSAEIWGLIVQTSGRDHSLSVSMFEGQDDFWCLRGLCLPF